MIPILILLFSKKNQERNFLFTHLLKLPVFYVVFILFWILPVLNLFLPIEPFFAMTSYSGNKPKCELKLSESAVHKLPYYVQSMVRTDSSDYVLVLSDWYKQELRAEFYAGSAVCEKVLEDVRILTNSSKEDVKLVYIPKSKMFEVRFDKLIFAPN
jgi:hypothetical protein